MKNKFLTIFLGIIINSFFINYCSAILSPIATSTMEVGITTTGSSMLHWFYDEPAANIKQFKILWRQYAPEGGEAWEASYPPVEGTPNYSFSLRGLDQDQTYEWRIRAEAKETIDDSAYTDGENIITPAAPVVIEPEEEGGEEYKEPIKLMSLFEDIGNLQEATDALMEFLLLAGFAIGPILIIYAGFLLLTKQDDPTAAGKAKKIILLTVISLSIMLFAKGIPAVVKDLFK